MLTERLVPRLIAIALISSMPLISGAQTTINGSIQHDGLQRDYILYVPAIYSPGTPVPLVFNLHGYTSDNLAQLFYGEFRPIADTANFIMAVPNGTIDGQGNRFWNAFGGGTVDDLGFITALIDSISAEYSINADRVYSTGMSNGGYMSYELACFRSERFAAIASVTGTMALARLAQCNATHPTPVMQIHGTADPVVNYNGSPGVSAIEPLVAHWVQFNNCDPTPAFTAVPNVNTTDGCTAEHYVYNGGDAGSTVEFYKIIGGGHTWPGSAFTVGVTNQDFSASKEIWRFFRQYTLGGLTGIAVIPSTEAFSIAPNPSSDAFLLRFEDAQPRRITISNATGQLVSEQRSTDNVLELRVPQPGIYFVSVVGRTSTSTQRAVRL
ncbi:MAG: prolyl oligopeptidase family serine peptidase [Flavobacteriales bacterium]|nr:prolyl oligopeptidase family serine peptidase [Flavobacteriales bacterium]